MDDKLSQNVINSPEWSYRIYGKGGGTVIIPPEAGNLTGIIVSKMPKKLDYIVGDSLNTEGLEVKAIYDNDVTGIVTEACTLIINDPLSVNDTIVKINYEGFETYFNIKVYAENLEIPAGTTHLFHFDGDYINEITGVDDLNHSNGSISNGKFGNGINGQYITLKNSSVPTLTELMNGSSFTVEAWCKSNGYSRTFLSFGDSNHLYLSMNSSTIKVVQSGTTIIETSEYTPTEWNHIALVFKEGYVSLFINGKKIDSKKITSSNSKGLVYIIYDNFGNIDELLISTEALYTTDFEVPAAPYAGKIVLDRVYIDTPPNKTTYEEGEIFSLEGASIKAVYSTGIIMDITSECEVVETNPLVVGDEFRTIRYTYEGVTKTVYVNVGVYTNE